MEFVDVVEWLGMAGYSLALLGVLVLGAPYWLARMFFAGRSGGRGGGRYRAGLEERLGLVPAGLREVVRSSRGARRVVWVHAVSVGEVLAAIRLVAQLETALGEGRAGEGRDVADVGREDWIIVVSTTTATGQALARARLGVAKGGAAAAGGDPGEVAGASGGRVFYYPLDFAWAVRAYLRVLQPKLLVLMESEIWPRMLVECGRRGVPVAVVNARVSDRSYARGVRVRAVWGRVLGRVSLFLAQSEEDGRRLVAMGARASSVKAIGNLKYDVRAPAASRVAELIRELAAGRPIVVAGSTVGGMKDSDPDEEGWIFTVWGGRPRNEVGALLVVAPRHPERFQQVWKQATEFPTVRATELLAGEDGRQSPWQLREPGDRRPEVVILDTIGDLAAVYGVADLAFVGGSLLKRGGHNPLEPAQFGVPVLMGPSFENFREIVTAMRAVDGICITAGAAQLPNERSVPGKSYSPEVYVMRDSLETEMMRLLTDRGAAQAMGERGRAVFEAQSGATGRAVDALVGLIRGASPAQGPDTRVAGKGGSMKAGARGSRRTSAWPLVPVYAAGLAVKDGLRRAGVLRTRRLGRPVVSVGSLSAGGAGKTPVVIALAELLQGRGWAVDVLSRGYGRSGVGVERVDVGASDAAGRFGDEPVVIARRTGVAVWVGADRYEAGAAAEASAPATDRIRGVLMLDDGFQHRRLERAVDVVLVTEADLDDRLLPAGNRREPLTALRRADVVVLREEERGRVETRVRRLMSVDAKLWSVRRELRFEDGAMEADARLLGFCAIARPEGFRAMLGAAGCKLAEQVAFADHHRYDLADIDRLVKVARTSRATGFVTTEKDAVKFTAEMRARLEAVGPLVIARLDAVFLDEADVMRELEARIR